MKNKDTDRCYVLETQSDLSKRMRVSPERKSGFWMVFVNLCTLISCTIYRKEAV